MRRNIRVSAVAAATAIAALAGATQADADIALPTVEVDTAKVAQILNEKLGNGNTVGYAFAIAEDGKFAAAGAGGKARVDKNIAFTPYTRMEIGSATKNISAAALLKLVEQRGGSAETKLWTFLPPDMRTTMHASWKNLAVRHILSSTSGIGQMIEDLPATDAAKVNSSYEGIKFMMTKEIFPNAVNAVANENMNYAVARIVIPELWSQTEPGRGVPVPIGSSNSGEWTLNYINERLFAPAGITPVACAAANPDIAAHYYNVDDLSTAGKLWDTGLSVCAGHRGLQMSAMDLVRWQAHLRHGTVVSPTVRTQMDQHVLGWSSDKADDGAWVGSYGRSGDLGDGWGRQIHSCHAKFPGNVEASVLLNSQVRGGAAQCTILLDAVKAATS